MTDVTLIAASTSTKNQGGESDLKSHQSKKGNQWHKTKKQCDKAGLLLPKCAIWRQSYHRAYEYIF